MSTEPLHPLYDEIAAQYVLGTLSADSRARFEARMLLDADMQSSVAQWEQRLLPLLAALPPVEPSAHSWSAIEGRLFRTGEPAKASWWQRLGWGAALAGMLLVAGLSAMITANVINQRDRGANSTTLVAALNDSAGATSVLLKMQAAADGRLAVVAVSNLRPPVLTASQVMELWTIAPGAAPRSLGILPGAATAAFSARGTIGAADTLAVSVEPPGGSTTGAPTGPVILQGKVLAF